MLRNGDLPPSSCCWASNFCKCQALCYEMLITIILVLELNRNILEDSCWANIWVTAKLQPVIPRSFMLRTVDLSSSKASYLVASNTSASNPKKPLATNPLIFHHRCVTVEPQIFYKFLFCCEYHFRAKLFQKERGVKGGPQYSTKSITSDWWDLPTKTFPLLLSHTKIPPNSCNFSFSLTWKILELFEDK